MSISELLAAIREGQAERFRSMTSRQQRNSRRKMAREIARGRRASNRHRREPTSITP